MTGDALTEAQVRLRDEVLGWRGERPDIPPGLVAELSATLSGAVAAGGAFGHPPGRRQVISASQLSRPPDTPPFGGYDAAKVRGVLLWRGVTADLAAGHVGPTTTVVDAVITELASRGAGDPASPAAWWNTASPSVRGPVRDEVTAVLSDLRLLWPPLDPASARVTVAPVLRVPVQDLPVVLTARPLVVVDSPRRDDRARAVVLVGRTGLPRPQQDRLLARITAVVLSLATERPPFRWGILHVTDGRVEVEDLGSDLLLTAAVTAGARVGTVLQSRGDRRRHAGRAEEG